jgi:arabinose-5-phosphate isomerase
MRQNKLLKTGREVIKLEIESLKKLQSSLGSSFEKVIKTIINNRNGNIIISGVGKSGIIGKK